MCYYTLRVLTSKRLQIQQILPEDANCFQEPGTHRGNTLLQTPQRPRLRLPKYWGINGFRQGGGVGKMLFLHMPSHIFQHRQAAKQQGLVCSHKKTMFPWPLHRAEHTLCTSQTCLVHTDILTCSLLLFLPRCPHKHLTFYCGSCRNQYLHTYDIHSKGQRYNSAL